MSDSKTSDSIDLWKDFESDEGLKPGKTDGSQWQGKFDRRKHPRDDSENDSAQASDNSPD